MRSRAATTNRSSGRRRSRTITRRDNKAALLVPELPCVLIEEVLARIPVKSVLRFKLACRPWHSLLSHPDFITAHRNHHSSRGGDPTNRFVVSIDTSSKTAKSYSLASVFRNNPTSSVTATASGPPETADEFPHPFFKFFQISGKRCRGEFIGTCNGLFCLQRSVSCTTDSFTLWNPSTRLIKRTCPPWQHFQTNFLCDPLFGFGYDASFDDYKVVVLHLLDCQPRVHVDVFSLKANSWRTMEPTFSLACPYIEGEHNSGVLLGGALHWNVRSAFLSFNLATEEFRFLPHPFLPFSRIHLGVLDGCLCAVIIDIDSSVDVWIMKEYAVESSWALLASLKRPPDLKEYPPGLHLPIDTLVLQNLMCSDVRCAISLVRLKDKSLRYSVLGFPRRGCVLGLPCSGWKIGFYEESLVSPYADSSHVKGEFRKEIKKKKKKKKKKTKTKRAAERKARKEIERQL